MPRRPEVAMSVTVRFAAALVCLTAVLSARGQSVWTGAISTDWNNAGNWSPSGVPNSATATVSFTGNGIVGGSGSINISPSVQAQALTFSNPTGNYTLTSSAGQTLSGLNSITVAAGV